MSDADPYAHRRGDAVIELTDERGVALSDTDVQVRQLRHAFQFGCTAVDLDADESLRSLWLDLFDTATLPRFYWGRYEPERGRTRRDAVLRLARWYAERGVRLKGHPLVWHTVKPRWLDELPLPEAETLLRGRIRREVRDFAGLVDAWDVINETVIMPRFDNEPDGIANAVTRLAAQKGRVEMVRLAVDEARSVGTASLLVLNDFDLGPEYEHLIEDVLDAGIPIDAIGLQSHMHQGFRGEDGLREICDRFARFGLPLHWTETTLVSGDLMPAEIVDLNDYRVDAWPSTAQGEQRQAAEIVRHYRTLVEHPAVQSITYWGLDDATAWLGAPAGLVRTDGTPKPAYRALHDLIRGEWWLPPQTSRTDQTGRITLAGFAGTYEITTARGRTVAEIRPGASQTVAAMA